MNTWPYVLLSVAMSIDGYIDDATSQRLLLSDPEDFTRVDEVRASCDAIMIGASTIRKDNPSFIFSDASRTPRISRALPHYPVQPTLTNNTIKPTFNLYNPSL